MNDNERFRAALAATLRAEKAARSLTDAELGALAGIPPSTLATYLKGTADVKMVKFLALASALSLTAAELMNRAEARMGDV